MTCGQISSQWRFLSDVLRHGEHACMHKIHIKYSVSRWLRDYGIHPRGGRVALPIAPTVDSHVNAPNMAGTKRMV